MPTQILPFENIAKIGFVPDTAAVNLPLGAWSDVLNVRFDDGSIHKILGEIEILPTNITGIKHIVYWQNPNQRSYVVIAENQNVVTLFTVTPDGEGNGVAVDRTPLGLTAGGQWQSTQFNGGYSIIINNGIDTPLHLTVNLGQGLTITDKFVDLPNWSSYTDGTFRDAFLSVSAGIVEATGNVLLAGDLTERITPRILGIDTYLSGLTGLASGDPTADLQIVFTEAHGLEAGDSFQVVGAGTSAYDIAYNVSVIINPTTVRVFTAGSETLIPDDFTTVDPVTVAPRTPGTEVYNTSAGVDREVLRSLSGVVRVSSVAAPGAIPQNWNPFADGAGTADEVNLADTGKITAIKPLRGNPYVYTSDSITQLRITEAGLVHVPITGQYGAISHTSVFEFRGQHLVVGSDDIYIFSGNPGDIQSIADGKVRKYFYGNLNADFFREIRIERNQEFDELWMAYPTLLSTDGSSDEALIWNYIDNTWSRRQLPNINSLFVGPIPGGGTNSDTIAFSGGPTGQQVGGTQAQQTITVDAGTTVDDGIQSFSTYEIVVSATLAPIDSTVTVGFPGGATTVGVQVNTGGSAPLGATAVATDIVNSLMGSEGNGWTATNPSAGVIRFVSPNFADEEDIIPPMIMPDAPVTNWTSNNFAAPVFALGMGVLPQNIVITTPDTNRNVLIELTNKTDLVLPSGETFNNVDIANFIRAAVIPGWTISAGTNEVVTLTRDVVGIVESPFVVVTSVEQTDFESSSFDIDTIIAGFLGAVRGTLQLRVTDRFSNVQLSDTTTLPDFSTASDVAAALQVILSLTPEFTSSVDSLDPTIVRVSPTQFGNNAATYEVLLNPGTAISAMNQITAQLTTFTVGSVGFKDDERPWSPGVLNEARSYIVATSDDTIYAMDVTYSFSGEDFTSYLERDNMHLAPTKDTELFSTLYMDTSGGDGNFELKIIPLGNSSEETDFDNTRVEHTYVFNYGGDESDYKTDTRINARLFSIRLDNSGSDRWRIDSMSIEIGKGGTR